MKNIPHKYVLSVTGNDKYQWIIFCEKCGNIAWFGNGTNKQNEELQRAIPDSCIGETPKFTIEPPFTVTACGTIEKEATETLTPGSTG